MPKLIFSEAEIEAEGEGCINSSGNIYIEHGRKYAGRQVKWILLKAKQD